MLTGRCRLRLSRPLCVVALLTTAVAPAAALEPPDASRPPVRLAEARCPVTGEPVVAEHHTRLRGRRVYCATAAACDAFQRDPYAYQDGLLKQWEVLRPVRVQLLCPVTGKPVRRDVFLARHWDELYFASDEAREAWRKHPDRYRDGLARAWSFQTTCGTCEALPRADVSVQVASGPVYFCCPGCRAAFEGDRAAFLKDVTREKQANQQAWERAHGPRAPTSKPTP